MGTFSEQYMQPAHGPSLNTDAGLDFNPSAQNNLPCAVHATGLLALPLAADELNAVFQFFDRDGGGCDFGEFAYAFYNRRTMAARVQG